MPLSARNLKVIKVFLKKESLNKDTRDSESTRTSSPPQEPQEAKPQDGQELLKIQPQSEVTVLKIQPQSEAIWEPAYQRETKLFAHLLAKMASPPEKQHKSNPKHCVKLRKFFDKAFKLCGFHHTNLGYWFGEKVAGAMDFADRLIRLRVVTVVTSVLSGDLLPGCNSSSTEAKVMSTLKSVYLIIAFTQMFVQWRKTKHKNQEQGRQLANVLKSLGESIKCTSIQHSRQHHKQHKQHKQDGQTGQTGQCEEEKKMYDKISRELQHIAEHNSTENNIDAVVLCRGGHRGSKG